jgi:hypothetical protein
MGWFLVTFVDTKSRLKSFNLFKNNQWSTDLPKVHTRAYLFLLSNTGRLRKI